MHTHINDGDERPERERGGELGEEMKSRHSFRLFLSAFFSVDREMPTQTHTLSPTVRPLGYGHESGQPDA